MNLITARPKNMSMKEYREIRRTQNANIKNKLNAGVVVWNPSDKGTFQGSVRQELIKRIVKKDKKKHRPMQEETETSLCRTHVLLNAPRLGRYAKRIRARIKGALTPKSKAKNRLYLYYNPLASTVIEKLLKFNCDNLDRAKEIYTKRAGLVHRLKDEKNIIKAVWIDSDRIEHEIKLIHPIAA